MAWSRDQINNAALIYKVGRQMGMSDRDIQIGLITAMVESNLVNVQYGDRDSLGLFQQRPSQGWGTADQVMNPTYAAKKFFSSLRGLGDRRTQMSMGAAAQAVQRSAYPDRYAQRISDMRAIWPRVATSAGEPQTDLDGDPYGKPSQITGRMKPQQVPLPDDTLSTPGVDMLGAWDTATPLPSRADLDVDDPARLIIGPETNKAVIQKLAQQTGGYEKGVDGWRKAVVEIAQRYLGKPYAWGKSSPSEGFDCSGLVQYVYSQAGKNLPRVSYAQANAGKRIGLGSLQPGDLVAWDNSSRNNGADHIAIYIGHGQIIEAPRPGLSVRIRSLGKNEGAWGVSLG